MVTQPVNPRPGKITFVSVTISTNASGVSDSINLTGYALAGIQMSTAWTDAGIGYKNSVDGSTNFGDMYDATDTLLVYTTTANRFIIVDPVAQQGLNLFQLVSETTAGAAVAQAASRTLVLTLYGGC